MTSYQPGEPGYTAPQDPWSGAPGVASPPTDPIPQAPRGQFAPGVAAPVPPPPSVWSQETIAHSDPYRPPPRSGRTGLYILVTMVVLVLGGAGGFGAWYLITERICPGDGPCNAQPQSPTTEASTDADAFQPDAVRVGDCLVNHGTATNARMKIEPCETVGALRVLKIEHGEQILENSAGKFDRPTTADPICTGVTGWDQSWFAWNSTDDTQDYFYCLDNLGG